VLEDLRPISIFPKVDLATEVGVAVAATLVISGVPLPTGTSESINASQIAQALIEVQWKRGTGLTVLPKIRMAINDERQQQFAVG